MKRVRPQPHPVLPVLWSLLTPFSLAPLPNRDVPQFDPYAEPKKYDRKDRQQRWNEMLEEKTAPFYSFDRYHNEENGVHAAVIGTYLHFPTFLFLSVLHKQRNLP